MAIPAEEVSNIATFLTAQKGIAERMEFLCISDQKQMQ